MKYDYHLHMTCWLVDFISTRPHRGCNYSNNKNTKTTRVRAINQPRHPKYQSLKKKKI